MAFAVPEKNDRSIKNAIEQDGVFDASRVITFLWQAPFELFTPWCKELTSFLVELKHQKSDVKKHHQKLVVQFRKLHNKFFSSLCVDMNTKSLVYCPDKTLVSELGMFSLLSYWKYNGSTFYHDFYACYFDCLAFLFINAVYDADKTKDSPSPFVHNLSRAERYYAELHTAHRYLAESSYDLAYSLQLLRYHELLSSVRAESARGKEMVE